MKSLTATKAAPKVKTLDTGLPAAVDKIYMWPVDNLHVIDEQTRDMENVTPESLEGLAASIGKYGVIEPLIITSDGGITAGNRRWLAAKQAGLKEVPVILRESMSSLDSYIINASENLQRENLSPLEEGRLFSRMIERYSLTQDQVAESLGVPRLRVVRLTKLLTASDYVKKLVTDKHMSWSTAAEIAALAEENQNFVAKTVVDAGLDRETTRQVVQSVKSLAATVTYVDPGKNAPVLRTLTVDEVKLLITSTMAKYAKNLHNQIAWLKMPAHSTADFYRAIFKDCKIEDPQFGDAYLSMLNDMQAAYAKEMEVEKLRRQNSIKQAYTPAKSAPVNESQADEAMDIPVREVQKQSPEIYAATLLAALKKIVSTYANNADAKSNPHVSALIDIATDALMQVNEL